MVKALSPAQFANTVRRCLFTPYRKGMGPSFALTMWDTGRRDEMGKNVVGYRLNQIEPDGKTETLFLGEDFCCSPTHCIDSDSAVESLMGFLTLRKGDTDDDYFKDYTAKQLEYSEQHAEALIGEVQARFCDENGNVKKR